MSLPLRIEYPGAWYHIMNRGGRYEAISKDKSDYSVFLELLREAIEIFHVNVSAFCLMQHHYHLLIQTPGANISRSMRHLRSDTLSTICKEFGLKKDSHTNRKARILAVNPRIPYFLIMSLSCLAILYFFL